MITLHIPLYGIIIWAIVSMIIAVIITRIDSINTYGCWNAPDISDLAFTFFFWPIELPFLLVQAAIAKYTENYNKMENIIKRYDKKHGIKNYSHD